MSTDQQQGAKPNTDAAKPERLYIGDRFKHGRSGRIFVATAITRRRVPGSTEPRLVVEIELEPAP